MIINGNLKFHTLGSGELQNAIMERFTTASRNSLTGGDLVAGRLIFNTSTAKYNFYDGTQWIEFATGGNASAIQAEVDAIETASGGVFDTDGTYGSTAVDAALSNVTTSTSLLNALQQLDSAITAAAGVDTLGELTDVTITTAATNDMLVYTGTVWEDRSPAQVQTHLGLVPGTDVQAHHVYLDQLSGFLNPQDGDVIYYNNTISEWTHTGPGAASGVQAHDLGLDSISGLTTSADQMIYTTASDTYATTSLSAFARTLLDDADATAALATLGATIGTNVQAWDVDLDEIAGLANVAGDVLYTNGSGNWAVAQPGTTSGVQAWDVNLDEIAALSATDGNFIVGNGTSWVAESGATARTSLDVYSTTEADTNFVNVAGDTMTGDLNMGSNQILSLASPTNDTDAANKGYVDSRIAGLTWKNSAVARTTANVDLASGGLLTVDGVTLVANDRVLVAEQTLPAQNGIYVAAVGAWTRATDFDSLSPIDEVNSAAVFVEQGTTHQDTGWTVTSNVVTLDTDPIVFTQFNGASGITAGVGLEKSGNTIDVNLGAGIVALPTDEVGIELHDSSTGAIILTDDGSARATTTSSKLHLLLDGTTLSQGSAGLKVPSQGITETELHTSIAGNGLAGGAGTALSVNVDNSSIEVVGDALQVKASGVTNAMLANATISMAADTGTADAVALGETFTMEGGSNIATVVDAALNKITVNWSGSIDDLSDVDVTTVAPSTDDVMIWDGTNWVPGNPVNSTSELTDVTAAATQSGQILVSDGTNYTPEQIYYLHSALFPSSSVTVTHNLGQQYVNVTVVDSGNSVIIPQSIVMTNANSLTVTFNTAISCKIIVMGIPGGFTS